MYSPLFVPPKTGDDACAPLTDNSALAELPGGVLSALLQSDGSQPIPPNVQDIDCPMRWTV